MGKRERRELALPSGKRARFTVDPDGAPLTEDVVDDVATLYGRALNALLDPMLELELADDAGSRSFIRATRDRVFELLLPDFHALRDALGRLGVIAVDAERYDCRNCSEELVVDPRELPYELFVERFADAPPIALERKVKLRRPWRTRQARVASLTMRAVRVGDARALWADLVVANRRLALWSQALVRASGLARAGALDGHALVRALDQAPDHVILAIERTFMDLAYSPRAIEPFRCTECGAMHEIEMPADREIGGDFEDTEGGESFPTIDVFTEWTDQIANEVLDARKVRIPVMVEPGVPAVDDGGEPLLGSYEPIGDELALRPPHLVTVYYRTFERMWREDGPYDIRAEIRDTIDHEVEHHLFHLSGHDPMDAEERAEIDRDTAALYGLKTVRRAREAAAVTSVALFLLVAVPVVGLMIALYLFFDP